MTRRTLLQTLIGGALAAVGIRRAKSETVVFRLAYDPDVKVKDIPTREHSHFGMGWAGDECMKNRIDGPFVFHFEGGPEHGQVRRLDRFVSEFECCEMTESGELRGHTYKVVRRMSYGSGESRLVAVYQPAGWVR